MVKTLGCALAAICSSPITVVGVGALKPLDWMREPVTTMSCARSSAWSEGGVACGSGSGAVSCAMAGAASMQVASAARLATPARRHDRADKV